jgi:hypothetical protein
LAQAGVTEGATGGGDVVHAVVDEIVHLVPEAVISGPPPEEVYRGSELGGLVGVTGVGISPPVHGAVGDDLVDDLPGRAVDHTRNVTDRAQVGLGRVPLAGGDQRVGGVGTIGPEVPRVVRITGADAGQLRECGSGVRIGAALIHVPDLSVGHGALEVGHVELAPVEGVL